MSLNRNIRRQSGQETSSLVPLPTATNDDLLGGNGTQPGENLPQSTGDSALGDNGGDGSGGGGDDGSSNHIADLNGTGSDDGSGDGSGDGNNGAGDEGGDDDGDDNGNGDNSADDSDGDDNSTGIVALSPSSTDPSEPLASTVNSPLLQGQTSNPDSLSSSPDQAVAPGATAVNTNNVESSLTIPEVCPVSCQLRSFPRQS